MSKLLWLKAGFAEMVDFAFAVMNMFLFLMSSFSFSFHQLNRPGFTNRALLFFTSFFLRLKRQLFFFLLISFFFLLLDWSDRTGIRRTLIDLFILNIAFLKKTFALTYTIRN